MKNKLILFAVILLIGCGNTQGSLPGGHTTSTGTGTAVTPNSVAIGILVWQKLDDGIERNWDAASNYCSALTLDGASDWRLPTKAELLTIVDTAYNPTIVSSLGISGPNLFWTSTICPVANSMTYYYTVPFCVGCLTDGNLSSSLQKVRCVR